MPGSLLDLMDRISSSGGECIRGYEDGCPVSITGRGLSERARATAAALRATGVGKGDRVAVIAEKCPETIVSFFGIWLAGGIAVPVCETLKEKEMGYILRDCGAKAALCGQGLKARVSAVAAGQRTSVMDLALIRGAVPGEGPASSRPGPGDTAFLIYTSGSTGNPKGVILTHRNIMVNAAASADNIRMTSGDAVMSILPYWHVFALTAEIFTMLHVRGKIFIPASRATFAKDMALFSPTIVLSIPRIAEMLKRGIEGSVQKKPRLARALFRAAQSMSLRCLLRPPRKRGLLARLGFVLARILVLGRIRKNFGGRLKYFIGGGAPLDAVLQRFFFSIGIPMYQGYGLTEASPVISINAPHDFRAGTSGKIIPWLFPENGGDFCFEDPAGRRGRDLQGELLVRGDCVMAGYWGLGGETAEALRDGWLCTGDLGYVDADGFLVLNGRKKNLICLRGGEKFCPEFIEERLKSSPFIAQAMVVGEGCKRARVIVNVNSENVKGMGPEAVDSVIAREIRDLTGDFEEYQRPSGHLVLPDFTVEDGLMTATQKIRRHKVFEKYGREISGLMEAN